MKKRLPLPLHLFALVVCLIMGLAGCSAPGKSLSDPTTALDPSAAAQQQQPAQTEAADTPKEPETADAIEQKPSSTIPITEDMRAGFVHGDKPAAFQKYIVLHDTEGTGSPASVIEWWDSNGRLVAAHFVIGTDGTVYQCVPLDKIAHHAGYGNTGHNAQYGITEDGRDDMAGATWIGEWASDYGMNAHSIGIEMVHVGGSGSYPEEQLNALDALIAYIDAYYGFESEIIDHKAWRSGNSDTSPEFSEYLYSYQAHRSHSA
jgi:hypothetical protein